MGSPAWGEPDFFVRTCPNVLLSSVIDLFGQGLF